MSKRIIWDEPVEDGVYLNWDAEKYFRQETRGSSDWIKLFHKRHGWWWASKYNPDYVDPGGKGRTYGSALHALMLEGTRAYVSRFAVLPDKAAHPGLVETIDEMKEALSQELGADFLSGKSAWPKAKWLVACAENDITAWGNLLEYFELSRGTREPISAADDRMLTYMHQIAIDPERGDNASIRKLLVESEAHPSLAEVSIISTIDGIRRRWRIDKMMPGIDIDLKSLDEWKGRPLKFAVGDILARNGWDIQRADYHIGRSEAYRLIREGQLFGGSIEQRNYITEIALNEPTWDWLWIAYQKPALAGRAPVLMPIWDNSFTKDGHPGMLRQIGQNKLDKAIAFYKDAVAQFGLEQPWGLVEQLHYTEAQPGAEQFTVVLPHWINEDAPAEQDAYEQ